MKPNTIRNSQPFLFVLLTALGLAAVDVRAVQPVYGSNAMVVAQEPLAADIGLEVIKQDGNAVDAAVATGFALAVTYPYAGNIGGGGFMLIRMADGRTTFIDFRETAPQLAAWDMFMRGDVPANASLKGWLAVAVPGTVRGFEMACTNFGTMDWRKLLEPAIHLASDGFAVSPWQMKSFRDNAGWLSSDAESKRVFLDNGSFFKSGDRFRQPELAGTLKRIARYGADEFYEGETARLIVKAMQEHQGLITMDDLRYYRPKERTPLKIRYHGYQMITSPLPSAGGFCLLQMLAMLDGSGYDSEGAGSPKEYHYLADVMRISYADRNQYLADPDFRPSPLARLTDPNYLRERRDSIDPSRATAADVIGRNIPSSHEGSDTTHFSIVDSRGNAVAVTYTLNNGYGSGVTVPGAGFLLNDEMDDFTTHTNRPNLFGVAQSTNNFIAPRKRPLSSMTPTIVLKNDKPFMVLGAPGGTRIPSAVLQVMLNVIDFHMNIQDAVNFPRIHAQATNMLMDIERGVPPGTVKHLKDMGYQRDPHAPAVVARVEAILIHDGHLEGGHDNRGNGKAAAW
jgi:gamma-glutamyltranspeptidase/glutathione hydrolase